MQDTASLRQQADRWFRFAKTASDARVKARAVSRARDCLAAAELREAEDAAAAHGLQRPGALSRLAPLRRAALEQIARLDRQIDVFEAEAPRHGSLRASVLCSLRDRRRTLLESCGLKPANDSGERS